MPNKTIRLTYRPLSPPAKHTKRADLRNEIGPNQPKIKS